MKKLILLLPILLLCFSVSAERILFSMTVKNPTETTFKMEYRNQKDAKPLYYKLKLAPGGTTKFELDIPFEQLVRFTYGNESVRMYVNMDSRPVFNFEGGQMKNTLYYSGNYAAANQAIALHEESITLGGVKKEELGYVYWERSEDDIWSAREMSKSAYFEEMSTYEAGAKFMLMQKKSVLTSKIYEQLITELKYLVANRRLTYFTANRSSLSKEDIQSISTSEGIFHHIEWNRADLRSNSYYTNFLHGYMHFLYLPEKPLDGRYEALQLYDIVSNETEGFAKNYLQHKLIIRYLERTNKATFGNEKLKSFKAQNAYPQLLKKIELAYGGELALDEEAPAPQIRLLTENGKSKQLSDYRGKVVFISFWASWCKPCLDNFKKSEQLRKDLDAIGIILLNVSIDKTEGKFKDALIVHNILGINALAIDYDKCVADYDLSTIPAYYIIDKNGNFAFLSEGDGRDVRKEFRALLSQ